MGEVIGVPLSVVPQFFPFLIEHSSTVDKNENIFFFGDDRMPTKFFLSPIYDSSTVARN